MNVSIGSLLTVGVACASWPLMLVVHSAARRRRGGLILGFAVQLLAWVAVCTVASSSLEISPSDWVAGGAIVLTLALGWLQVFSTLCRGFSMQLLVELEQEPGDVDSLAQRYAGGRGIDWMLDKRLQGLRSVGLLIEDAGISGRATWRPTSTGRRVAQLAQVYKQLVGIGAGG